MSTLRKAQRTLLAERLKAKAQKDTVMKLMSQPTISELHGVIKLPTTCKSCGKELAVGTSIIVTMGNKLMLTVCDNATCILKAKEFINESIKDETVRQGEAGIRPAGTQEQTKP
jgi:hypothetical protein